ncbi:MAG: glutamate-cysteine ligase family protein [Rubrobacteraceae bacterium]
MDTVQRRIGLEQEFFLVDEVGEPSGRADEFLSCCPEVDDSDESFAPECSRGMFEVGTPPVGRIEDLADEYLTRLDLALRAGREIGVRLYPLSAYPLPQRPPLRDDPSYELQCRTLGRERFLHAGRCTGTHLHLELSPGTLDPETVVSENAPATAHRELRDLYNLAIALDPAMIALTRSSPFYEGRKTGLAVRTAHYRGSETFGWEGLYTHLPLVGGLAPYAASVAELVGQRLAGHRAWLRAMARAGVDEKLFTATGGDVFKSCWGPVRINGQGTVELRSIDSNYPEVTLAVATLVQAVAERTRNEQLSVTPDAATRTFEVAGDRLLVPDFEYLSGDLFHAATTGGVEDPSIIAYLDSIVEFAALQGEADGYLGTLKNPTGSYRTTEAEVLREFPTPDGFTTREEGLRLVRESCDRLENQVYSILGRSESDRAGVTGERF